MILSLFPVSAMAELIKMKFGFDNVTWSEGIYVEEEHATYNDLNQKNLISNGYLTAIFDTDHLSTTMYEEQYFDNLVVKGKYSMFDAGFFSLNIESDWLSYFLSHKLFKYDYQFRNNTVNSHQLLFDFGHFDLLQKNIWASDGFHHGIFEGFLGNVDSGNYTEINTYFSTSVTISFSEFIRSGGKQPVFLNMNDVINTYENEEITFNHHFSYFTSYNKYSNGVFESQTLHNFKEEKYTGHLKIITVNEPKSIYMWSFLIFPLFWKRLVSFTISHRFLRPCSTIN